MILVENFMGDFYLVEEIEFDEEENCFHEYWDGHGWKKVFIENYEEDFEYKQVYNIVDDPDWNRKMCVSDDEEYFILDTFYAHPAPDRVFFLTFKQAQEILELLDKKMIEEIKEYIKENVF